MLRKLYLLFAIRSVAKSLRAYREGEGQALYRTYFEELMDIDYPEEQDE